MQFLDFTRGSRTKLLAFAVILFMVIFVARLFYIQVIRHDFYVTQADGEQMKQFTLHAKRGEIYAMDGEIPSKLVMNEDVYTVWADPSVVDDKQAVIQAINEVAGGNTRDNFAQYLDRKHTKYQVLATKVNLKQARLLKDKKLAGVGFDAVTQRVYPEGQLASQLLGFVDAEGEGKYGFEQANNERLKGKNGLLKTVTDVRSVPLTIGDKNINVPAQHGENIVLSIDRNIQARVEHTLVEASERTGAKRISAVVMDPSNGQIMAMANMPTYDPSRLHEVQDVSLFNNATISHPYEVGSVAKSFTIATGLDRRVIAPESTYVNTDTIKVDDRTIGNASRGRKLGTVTMQDALDWSLNTGMVTIMQRLGDGTNITYGARQTFYSYLHDKLKLGQMTGIELAGEAKGTIISPESAQGNAVRYSNMSFGQGMDLTMVQTAAAFSTVINGGTYYKPTVIGGRMTDSGAYQHTDVKFAEKDVLNKTASDQAREMLHKAHYATYRPDDRAGYYIGGKTGTSQTIDPRTGEYRDDETIATYLGFGGSTADSPRYVIMTTVYGNGNFGGGTHAKPIFNDISAWLLDYLKLQPKG